VGRRGGAVTASGRVMHEPALMTCRASAIGGGERRLAMIKCMSPPTWRAKGGPSTAFNFTLEIPSDNRRNCCSREIFCPGPIPTDVRHG
jgi:hypothetical protein